MTLRLRPFARLTAVAAVVLTVMALAGCSLVQIATMEPPRVDITGVRLVSATLSGADVLVQFQVDNPNGVDLILDGVGYKLRLNGQPLLDGSYDQRTEIAASGPTTVSLPVKIRLDDLYRVIDSLGRNRTPEYTLDADLRFAVPVLGEISVPVSKHGKVPLDRLLEGIGR
jgi:LEA14-like dessication related protein